MAAERKSKAAYRNAVFAIARTRKETNGEIFKAVIDALIINYPKNSVLKALSAEAK